MLYCLYCGAPHFHTQNNNKYVCTVCPSTFYLNASGGVALILKDSAGNYLWTMRNQEPYKGCLDTVGGFVDPRESAEQTAIRECQEELGITLDTVRYLGSFAGQYEWCDIARPIINLVFEATLSTNQVNNISLSDEIAGIERHTLVSLPRDQLAPNIVGIYPLLTSL